MEDRLGLLRNTYLFAGLPDQDLRRFADLLESRSLRPQATLYREGDSDTTLYVVTSGRLKASARGDQGRPRVVSYLYPGNSFGARGLLTGQRRDVTIEAELASDLFCLTKRDFDQVLQERPGLREALHLRLGLRLRALPLFARLSDQALQRLALLTGEASYPQGATISGQGEPGMAFYILEQGRVALIAGEESEDPQIIRRLGPGDYFGERSLLTGQPRRTTARALEDSRLLYINRRDFNEAMRALPSLGRPLRQEAQSIGLTLSRRFPWQGEGEVLLVLSRKHPYAFFRSLWVVLLPLSAAAILLASASLFHWSSFWIYLGSALSAAAAIGLSFWLWLDWRNDYYAVTDKRVVHLEKTILVRESREEAPLENIQDISILMPGVMGRLLGFDDLSIQTAGAKGKVVFKMVDNAAWIRDKLFQQLEHIKADEKAEDRESIRRRLEIEFGDAGEAAFATVEPGLQAHLEPAGRPSPAPDHRSTTGHPLHTLRGYLLPYMRVEENGVVTWRKHWFRLIDRIVGPLILLFILGQLGFAAQLGLAAPPARFQGLFWTALAAGTPLALFLIWFRYEDWRNDVYQLTEDRIIDIERLPLGLREERKEASLSMIQDIGYEIPGVIANLLDYGNVVIETAGREAAFTFSWVHQPRKVQQEVFSRMNAFRERERREQKERRAEELLDWFSTFADLSQEQQDTDD